MAELSIDLMWTHADDAEFPNRHTVTFSGAQQVKSDAAPDWGGSELATNPEQALAAAMASCHMMTFLALAKKPNGPSGNIRITQPHIWEKSHWADGRCKNQSGAERNIQCRL